ncbi:type I toxin-antitoxin system Hok family toxin [Escherichia coli]|nr:type I toxin-antitoxin system Hok family toxin [Escherichia coli]EFI0248872.1 type I toxin-antitoxin system Hok family toxin [Escherichia coli]EGL9770175.1 type I toxin-antitoxin system Hok family toxin [Escherichia coli]GCG99602.1 phage maintenance protein [Escherichia coli]
MNGKSRLASYVPKGKERQAMKQQKAMLIALIVICLTVIVTALVTRKDLCEVRIRTGQTEVAVFVDSNLRSKSDQAGE